MFLSGVFSEGDSAVIVWQAFDLESGGASFEKVGPGKGPVPPDADFYFSGDVGFVPVNGALLAVLGKPDFNSVSLDTLQVQQYSDAPWPGFDAIFASMSPDVVIAVKTNQGRYAKIRIGRMQLTPWGFAIHFHWVTFSNFGRPLWPGLVIAGLIMSPVIASLLWSVRCVLWGGCP